MEFMNECMALYKEDGTSDLSGDIGFFSGGSCWSTWSRCQQNARKVKLKNLSGLLEGQKWNGGEKASGVEASRFLVPMC